MPVAGEHVCVSQLFVMSVGGVPATHAPLALQVEIPTQVLPPHVVPTGAVGFEHVPVDGLHVPATWQASIGAQTTGVPAHVPAVHTSFCVHAWPSLQAVPSATAGLEHAPVEGSHDPAA